MSGRWGRLGKNGFIAKTDQKCDFKWVEIVWVHLKSNKPAQKCISKSQDSYK